MWGHLDVPTLLTPAPSHVSRFCSMRGAKEVSNLVNRPIVDLLSTRVDSTSAEVVPQGVNLKLSTTTTRERLLHNHWDLDARGGGKKCLSEDHQTRSHLCDETSRCKSESVGKPCSVWGI
jgi:hypothetical protein